jgi:hypothetical protein
MNLLRSAMLAAVALVVATPATADDGPDLKPAPQATIVAGAKACLGATVDSAGQPTRFAGWASATPDQRKGMNVGDDGDLFVRDNVMIAYKPGKDGGCVVIAMGNDSFDPTTFYPQVSAAVGVTVQPPAPGAAPAPIALPNGEIIIPVVTAKTATAASKIILVFANSARQSAKKGN